MYSAREYKLACPSRVAQWLDRRPPRQMAFRRFRPKVSIVKESEAYNNHIERAVRADSKTKGVNRGT
jgi:hypothetical protein